MAQISDRVRHEAHGIVRWYLETAYGRWEGPGTIPYFADASKVGRFAIEPPALVSNEAGTLFQLLVLMTSYQSRRDVDIMAIQRSMRARDVVRLTSPLTIGRLVLANRCPHLRSADAFDEGCDVRRDPNRARASCATRPASGCHVKDATTAIGRMG